MNCRPSMPGADLKPDGRARRNRFEKGTTSTATRATDEATRYFPHAVRQRQLRYYC